MGGKLSLQHQLLLYLFLATLDAQWAVYQAQKLAAMPGMSEQELWHKAIAQRNKYLSGRFLRSPLAISSPAWLILPPRFDLSQWVQFVQSARWIWVDTLIFKWILKKNDYEIVQLLNMNREAVLFAQSAAMLHLGENL